MVFCYYPDKIVPIFRTEDLEHLAHKLGIDKENESKTKYSTPYVNPTLGQKYELLNSLILNLKQRIPELKDWDNARYMRFLFNRFPPSRQKWWG